MTKGYDPTRLYTLLLNTGLQTKDNALHQVIHQLIGALTTVNTQVQSSTGAGSGGGSSSQGSQGIQGIPGVSGIGIDGVDGIDGLDSFGLITFYSNTDPTWTISVPLTGGTVVMNIGQQRITINPAGTLLALTVTLPAGPVNNQVAGMAFTQVITGLIINAPGGATVVAPATSAAVDSTFRFIYQTSSTSWFPVS